MELEKFHILQRDPCSECHRHTIARIDAGIGIGAKQLPCASGSNQGGFGFNNYFFTGFNIKSNRSQHITCFIFQQINRKKFIKKMSFSSDILLIQGMQHRMTGAISSSTGSGRLITAKVLALSAKWALIDMAIL